MPFSEAARCSPKLQKLLRYLFDCWVCFQASIRFGICRKRRKWCSRCLITRLKTTNKRFALHFPAYLLSVSVICRSVSNWRRWPSRSATCSSTQSSASSPPSLMRSACPVLCVRATKLLHIGKVDPDTGALSLAFRQLEARFKQFIRQVCSFHIHRVLTTNVLLCSSQRNWCRLWQRRPNTRFRSRRRWTPKSVRCSNWRASLFERFAYFDCAILFDLMAANVLSAKSVRNSSILASCASVCTFVQHLLPTTNCRNLVCLLNRAKVAKHRLRAKIGVAYLSDISSIWQCRQACGMRCTSFRAQSVKNHAKFQQTVSILTVL